MSNNLHSQDEQGDSLRQQQEKFVALERTCARAYKRKYDNLLVGPTGKHIWVRLEMVSSLTRSENKDLEDHIGLLLSWPGKTDFLLVYQCERKGTKRDFN